MKKSLAVCLALAMTVGLTACGGSNSSAPTGKTETTASAAADSAADTAANTTAAGEAEDTKDFKIGVILIHDENSGYDMAHIQGIEAAVKELGLDPGQVVYKYNIPEDETCYDIAVDLAEQGCKIIFSDSYGQQSHLQNAAGEYPDTTFVACTGDTAATSSLDNFKNMFPYTYESRYVSGVVAGMKLKELMDAGTVTDAHVGYVGAYPYAEVVCGYTAFFLGVQSIVPEADMDVIYTNSWYDPIAEGEAAKALITKGCVIIGQHADSTGAPSNIQEVKDSGKEVYSVGYNIDMLAVAPTAALTSAQNNWSALYTPVLKAALAGQDIPADTAVGYADGGVMISALGESCADGTKEKVDQVWAAIKDGSLKIFDTAAFTCEATDNGSYVVDADGHVTSAFGLDTDGDWIADSGECIIDGAFVESVLRSAPYFSLRIKGINELS